MPPQLTKISTIILEQEVINRLLPAGLTVSSPGGTFTIPGTGKAAMMDYSNSGSFTIIGSSDAKQLVVRGFSTQTNALVEFQDGAGNVVSWFGVSGSAVFNERGYDQNFRVEAVGDSNGLLFDASTGCLGLGIAEASIQASRLHAYRSVTDPSSNITILYFEGTATMNSAGMSGKVFRGIRFLMYTQGTGTFQGSIYGIDSEVRTQATGWASSLYGANFTVTNQVGSLISNGYGLRVTVAPGSGTVYNAAGLVTIVNGTEPIGINLQTYGVGVGTSSLAIGLRIQDVTAATTCKAIETNAGQVIFNEGGDPGADFRVEGDTDVNLLFTDASADKIGIGLNNPTSKLDVSGDVEVGDANAHYFGDPTSNNTWRIVRSGNDLVFGRRESGAYVTKFTIAA
jgi:hypothetical protein